MVLLSPRHCLNHSVHEALLRAVAASNMPPTLHDLHAAIRLNDRQQVVTLLESGKLNINSSLLSCTALGLAIQSDNERIVFELLRCGADPDKLSCDWLQRIEPPLFAACRLEGTGIAHLLVMFGADVNCIDQHQHTPLWIAIRERNLALTRLLVKSGAHLSRADKWVQCPLYLAVKFYGREKFAMELILHGCRLDSRDTDGHTAIYWTLVNGQFKLAQLLLKAGCQLTEKVRRMILGFPPTNAEVNSNANRQNDDAQEGNNGNLRIPEILRENECARLELRQQITNPASLLQCATVTIRRTLAITSKGSSIWPLIDRLPISLEHKIGVKALG